MLRTPKCSRCRNHGFLVPVKGHAGKCRWKQCSCEKCFLITERQKIMAAQNVLKKQASEEVQEVSLSGQGPLLPSGAVAAVPGSSHLVPPPVTSGDRELGPECCVAARFPERSPPGPSPGLSPFQPVLGGRGCGHLGPSERAAVAVPSSVGPQIGMEAAGRGHPGRPEHHGPLPSPPFADFGKLSRLQVALSTHCRFLSGCSPPPHPPQAPHAGAQAYPDPARMGPWGRGGENAFLGKPCLGELFSK